MCQLTSIVYTIIAYEFLELQTFVLRATGENSHKLCSLDSELFSHGFSCRIYFTPPHHKHQFRSDEWWIKVFWMKNTEEFPRRQHRDKKKQIFKMINLKEIHITLLSKLWSAGNSQEEILSGVKFFYPNKFYYSSRPIARSFLFELNWNDDQETA